MRPFFFKADYNRPLIDGKTHGLKNRNLIPDLAFIAGSLPPSPADSGVSDVDPSSSSHNSDDDQRVLLRQQRNSGEFFEFNLDFDFFGL